MDRTEIAEIQTITGGNNETGGKELKKNGKITITGVNIVLFAFTLLFIFYQLVFTTLFGNDFFVENIYLTLIINEVVLILIPVLVYAFVNKLDFKETFRLRPFRKSDAFLILAISLPAYFVAVMLNNIAYFIIQFIGEIPAQPFPVPKNFQEYILGLLVVAVLPGICEEMMHRGLILKAYEKRGSMKAIIITAIFFGLFHFDITNLLGPVFLGLLIGYYVIRTNSIFAGMLAHFANNFIAQTLQYLIGDVNTGNTISISAAELGQVVILGLTCALLTIILLLIFRRSTSDRNEIHPPISSVWKDVTSIVTHWPITVFLLMYIGISVFYLFSLAYS